MPLKDIIISSFPQYCQKLDSGKDVCFRPIIVLEEKSLLLAKQSEDKITILKTLIDIMSSCFKENMQLYSICDFEQAFLLLRSKSLGEVESFSITCPKTDESVNISINLNTDVSVVKKNKNNKIKLKDDLLIVLSPPTIKTLLKYPNYTNDDKMVYNFIASCVKQIITQKEVIDCKDKNEKEIIEFIHNLTPQQFKLIIEYFDSLPSVRIICKYTTSDGILRNITLKGIFNLINFFFDHLTLELYYRQNFQMKYHHHYSLNEIENMFPWERSVYIEQIRTYLQEETDRLNHNTETNYYAS